MKKKQSFFLVVLSVIVLNSLFTACSNYYKIPQKHLAFPGSYQDIIFENRYWEETQDSSVATIELPGINDLQPDAIRSVIIVKKGISVIAGYLNWSRDNQYKYEIPGGRIVLYWKAENVSEFAEPVTIVIRLQK